MLGYEGSPSKKAGSRPQCTTWILFQCWCSTRRNSWLRPNELTATTKAARRIFSERPMRGALSNSSGPWAVKLKRRAAKRLHQHRHFGGVRAKMGMDVADAGFGEPAPDQARFGKIDQVVGQGPFSPPTHADGERKRAGEQNGA